MRINCPWLYVEHRSSIHADLQTRIPLVGTWDNVGWDLQPINLDEIACPSTQYRLYRPIGIQLHELEHPWTCVYEVIIQNVLTRKGNSGKRESQEIMEIMKITLRSRNLWKISIEHYERELELYILFFYCGSFR